MSSGKQKLNTVMRLGVELTEVKNVDVLLERILFADAGSIHIKQTGKLKFCYTQNDRQQKKLRPGKKLIYTTFSVPIKKTGCFQPICLVYQLLI